MVVRMPCRRAACRPSLLGTRRFGPSVGGSKGTSARICVATGKQTCEVGAAGGNGCCAAARQSAERQRARAPVGDGRAATGRQKRRTGEPDDRRGGLCICDGGGLRGPAAKALEDALDDIPKAGRSNIG